MTMKRLLLFLAVAVGWLVQAQPTGSTITFATIADMQAHVITGGQTSVAASVMDTNRGGLFAYTTDALTADGGVVFAATGVGSGFWRRQFEGPVNAAWWGMSPTETDNNAEIALLAAWLDARGGAATVEFNPGTYTFTLSGVGLYDQLVLFDELKDIRFVGNEATFYVNTPGDTNDYTALLRFTSCTNIAIDGITFSGDNSLDGNEGCEAVNFRGGDQIFVTATFNNLNSGFVIGTRNGGTASTITRNVTGDITAYNTRYPVLWYGVDGFNVRTDTDHAHRNTYLSGVRNGYVYAASKNCNCQDRFNLLGPAIGPDGYALGNYNVEVNAVDTGTTNDLQGALVGCNITSTAAFAGAVVTNANITWRAYLRQVENASDKMWLCSIGFGATNYQASTSSSFENITISGMFDCRDGSAGYTTAIKNDNAANSAEACVVRNLMVQDFTYLGPAKGDTKVGVGCDFSGLTNSVPVNITFVNSKPGRLYLPSTAMYTLVNTYLENPGNSAVSRRVGLMTKLPTTSNVDHQLVIGGSPETVVSTGAKNADLSLLNESTLPSLWYGSHMFTTSSAPTLASASQVGLYSALDGSSKAQLYTVNSDSEITKLSGAPLVTWYTNAGTYTFTPQSWTKRITVTVIGGGGGGGSGRRGAASSARYGGGGGGGAGFNTRTFSLAELTPTPATFTVVVGAGGDGGGAVISDDTSGTNGVTGAESSFGTVIRALGGSYGNGGTDATGYGGSYACSGGSSSLTATAGNSTPVGFTYFWNAAPGGGGGGGIDASNVHRAGGSGGRSYYTTTTLNYGAGGAAGGTAGGNGDSCSVLTLGAWPAAGAGGGGGNTGGAGGAGGAGGWPGGGGGGGGASANGANSGAGGDGAKGLVLVVEYP